MCQVVRRRKECERKFPLTWDKTKKMRERAKTIQWGENNKGKRKKREKGERKGKGEKNKWGRAMRERERENRGFSDVSTVEARWSEN